MTNQDDPGERCALIVSFEIVAGASGKFRALIEANAADSLRHEPGCLRFDVLAPQDSDAPQVVLYEIYTDRAAFERHLTTPHFLKFDRETRTMVQSKSARFFTLRENDAPPAGTG